MPDSSKGSGGGAEPELCGTAGMGPQPPQPGPAPAALPPPFVAHAVSLAGISLRSATPWQSPAEVTSAAGCRNPAAPGKPPCEPEFPKIPSRQGARSRSSHRRTGRTRRGQGQAGAGRQELGPTAQGAETAMQEPWGCRETNAPSLFPSPFFCYGY